MPINSQMGPSNWIDRPTRNPAPFGRSELQVVLNYSGNLSYGRLWDFNKGGMCMHLRGPLQVDVGGSHLARIIDLVGDVVYDFEVIVCWSRVGSGFTYVGVKFLNYSQVMPFLEKFSPADPWLSVNRGLDRSV